MTRAIWTGVLMLAVLWPSHTLSIVHGMPLDGRVAVVLIGLAFPVMAWLSPRLLTRTRVRAAIVVLFALKLADGTLLTPQGLCARFSTAAPYSTNVLTIPIEEPSGALRSWDVRADWKAAEPACTAIVDRPYATSAAFPAWFTNITRFDKTASVPLTLEVSGYVRSSERGLLAIETGDKPFLAALEAGTHPVKMQMAVTGDRWQLIPTFNGRDAFAATTLTAHEPHAVDRLAGVFSLAETLLVFMIALAWIAAIIREYSDSPAAIAWCVLAAGVLAAVGVSGRFERMSVLFLAGAVLVPIADAHRNLRGAMVLVGVPWLALIAARSLPQVAHVTTYTNDDWLAYQVAGYRIFMNGFWLEAGSRVFDYQPLYRWITGTLHLIFGDSSVGETLWDAVCLWLGAAVAFAAVNRIAGFRWAVAAAVGALATFWMGTIWYFVGRGLSEISAAGFGFIAALLLLGHRRHQAGVAVVAGLCAVLMFYSRLNHLLFAFFLLALLNEFDVRSAAAYVTTVVAGVALFATRTWWYTGVFSVLYGTSLKNNDTGLRLTTIGDATVWSKIWHSLRALVWMNEPPAFDPRAVLVVAGVLIAVAAVAFAPKVHRLVLAVAVVTLGACASAFLAHTHNYPGRMSIHLVPFAVAMTTMALAKLPVRWGA